jgi:hypothetical protein
MKQNTIRILLSITLILTLIATYYAPNSKEQIALPTVRSTASADTMIQEAVLNNQEASQNSNLNEILKLKNRNRMDAKVDSMTFLAAKQWIPSKPKFEALITQPILPQIPQAPALPFQVIGQLIEDGKASVFLKYNDQNLVVHVGDIITDTYKIESLTDSVLTLLYLPLNQKQTLELRNVY